MREITDEMLHKAVKEAVKTGLVPKYSSQDDYIKIYSSIKAILKAALDI